jgi:aspartyl/asparaginyl beta-hydroxylase (cupin superfamily)
MAELSRFAPNTTLRPHTGPTNSRLRLHLPLVVPIGADAGLTVGGESHRWEPGQCLVFDDSFVHEAWYVTLCITYIGKEKYIITYTLLLCIDIEK